jgi:ABC-type polysaccharide transport system permease subunit
VDLDGYLPMLLYVNVVDYLNKFGQAVTFKDMWPEAYPSAGPVVGRFELME